jgi:hypothetical protein
MTDGFAPHGFPLPDAPLPASTHIGTPIEQPDIIVEPLEDPVPKPDEVPVVVPAEPELVPA